MAIALPDIVGKIRVDDSALDQTEGKAKGFGSRFGPLIAVGAAAAGTAIVAMGKQMLDLGTNLELTRQKAQTVFGDSLPMVQNWAAQSASAMGITRSQATGLAANFADLLIPMGFTREQAAGMSTDVVGLSGALAEWSGGQRTATEVSQILAKAMLGEREGLKELGISINEADVQARLMANGQAHLTGAQLEQAKATATQQLIFEQSKDAQATFKEGGDTLARTQAEMKAKFEEVKESIASKLIPVFHAIFGFITDTAIPAVRNLFQWLGEKLKPVFDAVREAVERNRPQLEKLAEFLGKVVGVIRDYVLPILGKVIGFGFKVLAEVLGIVIDSLGIMVTVFDKIVGAVKTVIEWIGRFIDKLTKIKIPDWLTPGSPTPLEIGLRGIAAGFKAVSRAVPDELSFGVSPRAGRLATAGAGVTNNYYITVPVQGDVVTEGQLIEKIRTGLMQIGRRNGGAVFGVPGQVATPGTT